MCENELSTPRLSKVNIACEWIHLVRRGQLPSRDKASGHAIRSAIPENPMHAIRKPYGAV